MAKSAVAKNEIFKEKIILVSIIIVIFMINIININKLGVFSILYDEFGYWSNAAYLAGYDWSNATSYISYYSYGYSILLLPLFWIFDNPIYMYRTAIVINAILVSVNYFICYDISKKLAKNVDKYILMCISFVVSMYPSYIIQTNVAWSEILLVTIFWLITWFFVDLNNKSALSKFVLLGFLSIYIYIVHQRAIGICMSSIIVILLMKLFKRINNKQFLAFISIILVMSFAHSFIKNDIQINNYLSSDTIANNDFAGQIDKIKKIFTFNGLINLINILLGQIFYIGTTSFLLCYVGIYEILNKIKNFFALSKQKSIQVIYNDGNIFLFVFLIIASFSTLIISAIFMSNPSRIDQIIYGRYTETIIGPLILIGFINLSSKKRINYCSFVNLITYFILITIITNLNLRLYGFEQYNTISAAGLIYKPIKTNGYNIFFSATISIIICGFLCIAFKPMHKNKQFLAIILLCIASLFFITGEIYVNAMATDREHDSEIIKIVDYIENNNEEFSIYFLLNNDIKNDIKRAHYQFLLKDKEVISVTKDELNLIEGNKYIISGIFNNYLFEIIDEYDFCLTAVGSYLFATRSSEVSDNNGIIIPSDMFYKTNINEKNEIVSNGQEGFFMYGPYINLNSGNYQFTIDIELIKSKNDNIGYVDIVSNIGENQHFKQEISLDDFGTDNKLIIDVPFELTENIENIELRAYSYEGSQIKINNVYIKN